MNRFPSSSSGRRRGDPLPQHVPGRGLLGLPAGVSFAIGVQVYRANAPRAILKRQAAVINPPAPMATNGTKKPPSGRKFSPDQIRLIRQEAAEGVTYRELGERHGVDGSYIGEIVRRVAYADVV